MKNEKNTRNSTTSIFKSWDGTGLTYRTWPAENPGRQAVILIHRGHEHSARLQGLADDLDLPDVSMFSWDNRGHGQSPGQRGDAPSYRALVRDLDCFVKYICETYGYDMENISIVANSVGAVTAATWVHDYAPPIRCMVLAAPALRIRLYMPLAIPCLRLLKKFRPDAKISSYVKSKMLTHDPEMAGAYDRDELITGDISVRVLLGLHDAATRVMKDAQAIKTPTLVLSAGSDWVVKNSAQRLFYRNLGSSVKQMEQYKEFYHAVFYESERQQPIAQARGFLTRAFQRPKSKSDCAEGDLGGATRTEYDLLRQPASPFRQLGFSAQKAGMHSVGKLSKGVRIGIETGFDSGRSLDYVYENCAQGTGPLGKWIDRGYLNAVGWKGIRTRRVHIRNLLHRAIEEQISRSGKAEILDIATGCGRYVLDVLAERDRETCHARLRDWTEKNLEKGRETAQELNLDNVVFEQADAFDPECYKTLPECPNIVIVSGLYELFPDNEGIRKSLAAIIDCLAEGGCLIYTCQPWHPQVEMIARTLVNREGESWIMRRRTQGEMDALVGETGLKKSGMLIDEDGIFTVSVAEK